MESYRILVIEDDPAIGQSLLDGFRQHGFQAVLCKTGSSGVEHARKYSPHLIILDIRLPDGSGFDVCRQMRNLGLHQPVIMLTAQHDELDKVLGLEMGADDYMTKPFSPRELVARVKVVLRRVSGDSTAEMIRVGNVSLDRSQYEVQIGKRVVALTPTEFELMATLMSQPSRIFSRNQLLNAVHGVSFESYERAIDSHIRNLRRKLEPDDLIFTVHGVGYKFEA